MMLLKKKLKIKEYVKTRPPCYLLRPLLISWMDSGEKVKRFVSVGHAYKKYS